MRPVDPMEIAALEEAISRFEAAHADLVQAARRIQLLLRPDEPTSAGSKQELERIATPAPASPTAPPKGVSGYLGDPCRECGMFTLVRTGTCVRCNNCGWNPGCG